MVDQDRGAAGEGAPPKADLERIGVRELRQHASRWLRRVADGESFEITDRGRPVALLSPVVEEDSTLDRLLRSGQLTTPRQKWQRPRPVPLDQGPAASDVLAQMREEERY